MEHRVDRAFLRSYKMITTYVKMHSAEFGFSGVLGEAASPTNE